MKLHRIFSDKTSNYSQVEFKDAIRQYAEEPITRQIILPLLKEYKRPYDKISELIKQEILLPVKRGMYVAGPKLNTQTPEPFLLANHILGPSYVSIESALSYWGLIPENVYEITSMTIAVSKTYKTPLGRFVYIHCPSPYYSFGIKQVKLAARQTVLIASPEKALCDKIISTSGLLLRSSKQTVKYLTDDLRIDEQVLQNFDITEITSWIDAAPKKESLSMLVKTLENL
jgi:hypothetical protein